ncbi:MAG: hypothetical protein WAL85_09915 [Candidatus Korobacteraceae bacterium]
MPTASITPEALTRLLEEFLAGAPQAVAREDGQVLFDFSSARYSVSGEGKCVLHLWSEERNAVRRVVDVEIKDRTLRLQVLRFGKSQPDLLEICADRDWRTGTSKRAARVRYQSLLERVLRREYPGFHLEQFSSSPDLEHSLSPLYTRGMLRAGQSAFAVLGVNAEETQSSVDAALTFGILWMDYQRRQQAGRALVEGLKLFLPPGGSETIRQRAANLNCDAAKWQLYELDERAELCAAIDIADSGNIVTRLTRAVDVPAARERFAASIARIHGLAPTAEITVESGSEIVFRLYGLEFARACFTPVSGSFRNRESIVFGVGRAELELDESSEALFRELVQRICDERQTGGSHTNLFFRIASERWLESLVVRDVRRLDERLDGRFVYSQVPAFAAIDRAMLDVLTCTLDGRLAILELKADEDIHLPLQGLDYWARVRWHQQHGEFTRNGYFAGRDLSSAPPLLYLVAPALHVHPTTDVLLRYLSPRVEWTLVQLDEHWREQVRAVNRKHPAPSAPAFAS